MSDVTTTRSGRVLRATAPTSVLALAIADAPVDERTQVRIDAAHAAGYDAGFDAGVDAARAEASRAAEEIVRHVGSAVDELLATVRAQAERRSRASTELALRLAEVIVRREPTVAADVLGRVEEVLAGVDDPELVVTAHPSTVPLLTAALARRTGVSVEADEALAPTDARVTGRFVAADLGIEAALAWAAAVLGEGTP